MEAIAFDWSRIPGMEVHVELMVRVAKLVYPFLTMGGQGTVVNSEFIWQRGRDQLMEFLQAATCADELEELWKRMDDDDDAEVDPSGMVLEISGQQDAVFGQGNNETPLPIEDAGSETTGNTGTDGKAPEISPEEETTSGSSRLSGTRMLLWKVYSRVASNWDFSIQDRTTGRIFDSTKGYPGEGPKNNDDSTSSKRNLPWISEDHLDQVVAKKMEMSSDMNVLDGFVPEGEGQLEKVEVENVAASRVLRALWLKGFRAGQRKLCRAGKLRSQVVRTMIPANRVWSFKGRKPSLKMPKKHESVVFGSEIRGKPIMGLGEYQEGFPGSSTEASTTSTLGKKGSSPDHGNVHAVRDCSMDRLEAERLSKRRQGICYWFAKGNNRCRFGENCKFIHSNEDVVLASYWCKYYVDGRGCRAGKECKFSHDTAGVRCIPFSQTGRCKRGDRCVFEHERPRSPATPPRDRPKKGDGGRRFSPERGEDLGEEMEYDEETEKSNLIAEAVSYMSGGRDDIDRWEGEPIFKLLRITDEDQKNEEWLSWTDKMLSALELYEVVRSVDIPLEEVEEWVNDLRIWYEKAQLDGGSDPNGGTKRPLEEEFADEPAVEEVVPEVTEVIVEVDEEPEKNRKKRRLAATHDPYTLLVPRPKKRPIGATPAEVNVPAKKAAISKVEKSSIQKGEKASHRARSKPGSSAGRLQKKEKAPSPKKRDAAPDEGGESVKRGQASVPAASEPVAVTSQVTTSCKAIEEARREGLVSSIQRCLTDPLVQVQDLESILVQLCKICEAGRETNK